MSYHNNLLAPLFSDNHDDPKLRKSYLINFINHTKY